MTLSVEIGQYREVKDRGAWKATFSVVIYPQGQKILDCRYFVNGAQRWFNFPQKEIKRDNKSEYIPYISYTNKTYLEELKKVINEALINEELHEREKNITNSGRTNSVSVDPSASARDFAPF